MWTYVLSPPAAPTIFICQGSIIMYIINISKSKFTVLIYTFLQWKKNLGSFELGKKIESWQVAWGYFAENERKNESLLDKVLGKYLFFDSTSLRGLW